MKPSILLQQSHSGKLNDSINHRKQEIVRQLAELGLTLELADPTQLSEIKQLISEGCEPNVNNQLVESDLYRCLLFGYCVIIRRNDKAIAFYILVPYADPARTAYCIFTYAQEQERHQRLPVLASDYANIIAMENGQKLSRTWIAPDNYPSIANHLNHCGFHCDGFSRNLYMKGKPRILVALELTPEHLLRCKVDCSKLSQFIDSYAEGSDFILIDPLDFDHLEEVLREDRFRIVAFTQHQNLEKLVGVTSELMGQ